MKRCKRKSCAAPKPLTTATRDMLPDEAFALPSQRKYPIYKVSGGCLVGSASHATAAKGRARQQFNLGNLTQKELRAINQKANEVLRACRSSVRRTSKKSAGMHPDKPPASLMRALDKLT